MAKGLTLELIVGAGLELLDEVGLDGLTTRALAARLGVKAPALYWHVANKQTLVDEMATELWREIQAALPEVDPDTRWRDYLLTFATTVRGTLLRHRDGARLFSGTYLTDAGVLQAQEAPLALLVASGMSLPQAVEVAMVLYSFTIGATIEEQAVAAAVDDRYTLARREQRLDPARFPLITEAGRMAFPEPGVLFAGTARRLIAAFDNWPAGA
ncbi:TetR/AcrR family transcriptional regulator C-terminal domain-containing protein [Nakamurella lactea]|uniref:TetR/AcrR family transcriptional regulator C-terminal domain-containing protein n=1 Tax=Nakamurella lactea TaxID=459515 RepID=UPI000400F9E6|nr:TetR/AcrR family transcriptional regulator C-terminal domain-containing protein [Nakamurella lactea]